VLLITDAAFATSVKRGTEHHLTAQVLQRIDGGGARLPLHKIAQCIAVRGSCLSPWQTRAWSILFATCAARKLTAAGEVARHAAVHVLICDGVLADGFALIWGVGRRHQSGGRQGLVYPS